MLWYAGTSHMSPASPARALLLIACGALVSALAALAAAQTDQAAAPVRLIPFFPAASDGFQQGFARIINHGDESGTVEIVAIDDAGGRSEPLSLAIGAGQTRHFNSDDLESGNDTKGLTGAAGTGSGDWRLELKSGLDIEALAYIRTEDGFLTAMHDVAPAAATRHRVATFNPGDNTNQRSILRLVNADDEPAEVTITGTDDAGVASGSVGLTLPAGASRSLTAEELEAGGRSFEGALGDGAGKWALSVVSDRSIVAMSLLSSPTRHLTNLSTAQGRATAEEMFQSGMASMVQDTCSSCHAAGGEASDTGLVFEPVTEAGHLATNFDAVATFLATVPNGAALMLSKARGEDHGGGAPLAPGTDGYAAMERFVTQIEAEARWTTRAALAALFHATDGPNWADSRNWLTSAPIGEWYGVTTNASGRVVRLDLSGRWDIDTQRQVKHGLSGAIPSQIGNLTELQYLNLDYNELSGPIPPEIGNLARLEYLQLHANELTGPIPPELNRLVGLTFLSLSQNHLWGEIPELGGLTNLRHLALRENELSGGIPPTLGRLVDLETLDLGANIFSGPIPPELGNLTNLVRLSLTGRSLRGLFGPIPPELGKLSALQTLALRGNDLSGPIPRELGNLANLEFLGLDANELSGTIPPELGNLANLTTLYLRYNKLSGALPSGFVALPLKRFLFSSNDGLCVPGVSASVDWLEGIEDHDDGPLCNQSDQAVLETLYHRATGSNWTDSAGWLGEPDLGEWYGVSVDSLGRVTALDLSENQLAGSVANLGELSHLTELRLDGNPDLSGRLPSGLADLQPLKVLHYAGTGLCAPATPFFREWLGTISSVTTTDTECEPVSDREILVELYQTAGGASWIQNDGWLSEQPLDTWYGVETDEDGKVIALDLAANELRGPIPPVLGDLARLRRLDLGNNRLDGAIPRALGRLGALEELRLGGNRLAGRIPPQLGRLTNLRRLYLDGNVRLSSSIPRELGNLHKLEELGFQGCGLTGSLPPELGRLAQLETLRLGGSAVSGRIPPEIGGLGKLKRLDLRSAHLWGPIPREIGNLGELEVLDLAENRLTGPIPSEIGHLVNLIALNLASNELSGDVPPDLGRLVNLSRLSLAYNRLTGGLPPALGSLAGLESLVVAHNELTGRIPTDLGGLAQLRELVLTGNDALAGTLPTSLADIGGLEVFEAGGTALCAPSDAGFRIWLDGIPTRRIAHCESVQVAAYLTQAVQSRLFPVPLVAGEDALLRVFPVAVRPNHAWLPLVRASFYLDGASVHTIEIPARVGPIPTTMNEGSLSSSVNAPVPASVVQPGLEFVIEIDPEATLDPNLGVVRRIPENGRLPVDVRDMPVLELTLVPFLLRDNPDSSIVPVLDAMAADPMGHALLEHTRKLLPVGQLDVRVHEPVTISDRLLLQATEAIRVMEGRRGHYMGTMSPRSLGFGGGGQAMIGGLSSWAALESDTIAHELGHNMSLKHAPCGNPPGQEPGFPNSGGRIGSPGYDSGSQTLVPPTHADLMGYCDPNWISDYSFGKALEYRLFIADAPAPAAQAVPSLLLWGGTDSAGQPYLEPAFPIAAPALLPTSTGNYRITGHTDDRRELFSLDFAMPETADGGRSSYFAFAVPLNPSWPGALAAITLSGPEGTATVAPESERPLTILRNTDSGQVRGLLRETLDDADAARAARQGLEVMYSRGIPDAAAFRQ